MKNPCSASVGVAQLYHAELYLLDVYSTKLRTDLDIGAEKSETITVSDFFMRIFAVEYYRYPPLKMAFGEDLN